MNSVDGTQKEYASHREPREKKGEVTLRRVRRGDGAILSTLIHDVFEQKEKNEYWEWKFFENPAGEHHAYIALDGENIAGAVACIPMKLFLRGKLVTASQATDLVVSEKYRHGTPFYRLCTLVQKDVWSKNEELIYGFAKKEHNDIYTRGLAYQQIGSIRMMIKILNPAPFLRKKIKSKILRNSIAVMGTCGMKLTDLCRSKSSRGIEIREVVHFDTEHDELGRENARQYQISIARDSDYLNWRYFRNPTQKYSVFESFKNGKRSGFISLCLKEKDGINRGYIVDLVVSPGDEKSSVGLIRKAVSTFHDAKADSINAWIPGDSLPCQVMSRMMFVSRPTHHLMMVKAKPPGKETDFISNKSHWYFTLGDSDHY